MLIDWFTVLAQIVNFAVLVALLKRFLYGPLVAAIDAREQAIAKRVADAAQSEKEAVLRVAQLAREAAETDRAKAGLLAAAREDADRQRGEILDQARTAVKEMEAKWRTELEHEKAAFLDEVRRRAAAEILAATRGALRDLASADVECAALSAFLRKIGAMDPSVLQNFTAAGITVVSHDELPPETRERIACAVGKRLGHPAEIRFDVTPAMAWGIELRGNGTRIGWTPDAWLDSVEDNLRAELEKAAA